MFSALGTFVGKVFGSDKAIEKGIDTVSKGLDKLVYTSEEKAEAHAKDISEARRMLIKWMESTSGQNLARRFLALLISFTWLFMYLVSTALDVAIVWSEAALSTKITESAEAIGSRATEMNGAMMLILTFYFAAPHMDKVVGAAVDRFSGRRSPNADSQNK